MPLEGGVLVRRLVSDGRRCWQLSPRDKREPCEVQQASSFKPRSKEKLNGLKGAASLKTNPNPSPGLRGADLVPRRAVFLCGGLFCDGGDVLTKQSHFS